MTTTDLTVHRGASSLAIRDDQTEFDDKQRYALGLGKNVTGADLAIYFHVCKRTGLDPFARQIYMLERWTKDGPRQTIQTGIDGYRLIAKRAAGVDGYGEEDTQWCGPDGIWRDVWLGTEPPAAARFVVVYKGQRHPAVALYSEYVQTLKSGDPNAMWQRMPANQLAKCAEALALRKTFPQDLSGVYTEEEMGQADTPRTTTSHVTSTTLSAADFQTDTGAAEPPARAATVEASGDAIAHAPVSPETGEAITDGQRRALFAAFGRAGFDSDARSVEGRAQRLAYISQILGRDVESTNDLSASEASTVIGTLADAAEQDGADS